MAQNPWQFTAGDALASILSGALQGAMERRQHNQQLQEQLDKENRQQQAEIAAETRKTQEQKDLYQWQGNEQLKQQKAQREATQAAEQAYIRTPTGLAEYAQRNFFPKGMDPRQEAQILRDALPKIQAGIDPMSALADASKGLNFKFLQGTGQGAAGGTKALTPQQALNYLQDMAPGFNNLTQPIKDRMVKALISSSAQGFQPSIGDLVRFVSGGKTDMIQGLNLSPEGITNDMMGDQSVQAYAAANKIDPRDKMTYEHFVSRLAMIRATDTIDPRIKAITPDPNLQAIYQDQVMGQINGLSNPEMLGTMGLPTDLAAPVQNEDGTVGHESRPYFDPDALRKAISDAGMNPDVVPNGGKLTLDDAIGYITESANGPVDASTLQDILQGAGNYMNPPPDTGGIPMLGVLKYGGAMLSSGIESWLNALQPSIALYGGYGPGAPFTTRAQSAAYRKSLKPAKPPVSSETVRKIIKAAERSLARKRVP